MDKIIKIDDVEGKVYELDDWKPEQGVQVKKYFNEIEILVIIILKMYVNTVE